MAKLILDNRDPMLRRYQVTKWNGTVTAVQVPALLRTMPEYLDWTKARHLALSNEARLAALLMEKTHHATLAIYERLYGTDGPLISGGFRDHWPDYAKDSARDVARRITYLQDLSVAHWGAAGKRTPWYLGDK